MAAAIGIEAEWQRLDPRTIRLFETEAKRQRARLWRAQPEALARITAMYLFGIVRRRGLCSGTGAVPFQYAMAGALPDPRIGLIAPHHRLYFEGERVFW